ncbi:fatty acid desaturase, putative [Perkinsus marinus ATCC 50983]|uniref:Fatty acid desaturase, putative n=1 Tax=Perkinsus marinus (strain ATCC 50983 / TXsc) TaxID=423536 RepID=C5L309_PERM5|nr:fatty acid desaturase, putative [Perkinsus marinus ATCC 50983]EER08896.1 fatty acid desaturase, putative [Perkinsus marinus ATCC 50983]|eukprot:XP_002777080.1 fatty acid desaturase, putative [Perkinsus marinus ATCC 50983]
MPGHTVASPPPSPASTASTEETVSPSQRFKREAIGPEDTSEFTMDEVRRYGFIVIDNIIYNVTEWVAHGGHPGGEVLLSCLGRDVTSLFRGIHHPGIAKHYLPPLAIGRLKDPSIEDKAEADFAALERHVRRLGLYEQKVSYYFGRIAIVMAFLLLALTSLCLGWTMLGAIALGVSWQQGAFIAHDACHRGCGSGDGRSPSRIGWFIGSILFGISSSMWSEEHAAHHCFPRRPREDPQFNYLPTFLISRKELPYSNKWEELIAGVIVPIQHFVLAPVAMTIGRFNFYIISLIFSCKRALQYYIKGRSIPLHCCPLADLCGMSLFWLWYGCLLYQLVPPSDRLLFLLLSNCTAGVLHVGIYECV